MLYKGSGYSISSKHHHFFPWQYIYLPYVSDVAANLNTVTEKTLEP